VQVFHFAIGREEKIWSKNKSKLRIFVSIQKRSVI
jgi:hypothetical protein